VNRGATLPDVDDEPELYVFRFQESEEQGAERERQRQESRGRHLERMAAVLALADAYADDALARAEAVLDGFFLHRHRESDDICSCSCHPRLPDTDHHDYGSRCPCQQTAEERQVNFDAWMAEMDAYWASPEGQAVRAHEEAEEAALQNWLAGQPAVVITSHGGWAPEQWRGFVDHHSFYFRERHDHWRIELDLRPSGRFCHVWKGGDRDDEENLELKEIDEGDVIAKGTTGADGYGQTPLERAHFIVGTIRTHLRRQGCSVHVDRRDDLEMLLAAPLEWCPACGLRLSP
jgi:hypothetical protein